MSARVLKSAEPITAIPLPIPVIGEVPVSGQANFIVPPLDETQARSAAAAAFAAAPAQEIAEPDDILENARREAEQILADAEESRSLIRQAAHEQSRLDAEALIESEVTARVADLREELAHTVKKISGLSSGLITNIETDLVELALQIAKKVVRREVTIDREVALTLVRVSLGKLHQRTAVEVHLNPEDLSYIRNHPETLDLRGSLNLVEDPSISPGGCLLHTDTGDIDARIESQFDELAFGLLN